MKLNLSRIHGAIQRNLYGEQGGGIEYRQADYRHREFRRQRIRTDYREDLLFPIHGKRQYPVLSIGLVSDRPVIQNVQDRESPVCILTYQQTDHRSYREQQHKRMICPVRRELQRIPVFQIFNGIFGSDCLYLTERPTAHAGGHRGKRCDII